MGSRVLKSRVRIAAQEEGNAPSFALGYVTRCRKHTRSRKQTTSNNSYLVHK